MALLIVAVGRSHLEVFVALDGVIRHRRTRLF